ncbi:hypothetical protein K4A83_07690 [Spirulina subsalsa FACHB-351]|uniref:Uncharacterized protein n=1 Tax=Spirulina subsalsa FACHB-351 TaxID=234711 RepID=A0ABT3L3S7_9CYAN|nr:hypothetical protein [Spirulina subsalsa]MCW6036153.1 hypothetical protein [Spirulina subsalsa FACHB-351]
MPKQNVMSAPDRPYQSRLFNFINQQRIVWRDRLEQTARSVKLGAVWGLQVLVYPFYLLTQLGRSVGFTLAQKVANAPSLPPLGTNPPPDSNQPLGNLLFTVQCCLLPDQEPGEMPTIQGLACTLEEQALVLVTPENQTLDLLTPEQQQQIQQRILWEMADYAYQKYLQRAERQRFLIPHTLTDDPQVFPLLRRFWQFMRWIQQSPVAVTTNVFGEAHLVPIEVVSEQMMPPLQPIRPKLPPFPTAPFGEMIEHLRPDHPGFLSRLDARIALWEAKQDQWSDKVAQAWEQIHRRETIDTGDLEPWEIMVLIQGAIAYFFGPKPLKPNTDLPPTRSVIATPWLTWEDLYQGTPEPEAFVPQRPQLEDPLELGEMSTPAPRLHWFSSRRLKKPLPPESSSVHLATSGHSGSSPDYQPDWIETEVTPIGYVQHPLERLLHFFDAIMLAIEELLLDLWQFLNRKLF